MDEDGYFPERVAATYDDSADGMFDPAAIETTAGVLAELAGGGRALELGIGTGRIALPLARRGVEVHGIDLSRAMVARLRTTREVGIPPASFAYHTAAADPDLVARKIIEPEITVEWSILWPARVQSEATARFLESTRRCAEEKGWLDASADDG